MTGVEFSERQQARAAAQLRLVLAQTVGRDLQPWVEVSPCLTDQGTIGVVNGERGVAWDTRRRARSSMGTLCATTEPLFEVPVGWRCLALPAWRGYQGTPDARPVPTRLLRSRFWIAPVCVGTGLRTVSGGLGQDQGRFLIRATPHEHLWPYGVPSWIEGVDVSCIEAVGAYPRDSSNRIARGTDQVEEERIRRFLHSLETDGFSLEQAWAFFRRGEWITAVKVAKERAGDAAIDAAKEALLVEATLCVSCCCGGGSLQCHHDS